MEGTTLKVLLSMILQICATEMTSGPTSYAQNAITMPVDEVIDTFVGKLFDRKLGAWPLQNPDLDGTILGKPGVLANSQSRGALQARPVIPNNAMSRSFRPIISYNPTFQSKLISGNPLLKQDITHPIVVQAETEGKTTLHNLSPNPGAFKKKRRVARGYGGKGGGTGGRGTRGQKSRSGGGVRPGFEGGQTPLYRRFPKLKGVGRMWTGNRQEIFGLNVGQLQEWVDSGKLDKDSPITTALLKEKQMIRKKTDGVKLLGMGELKSPLDIQVQYASETAKQAVESSGGKLNLYVKPKWTRKARTGGSAEAKTEEPAAEAEAAPTVAS